MKKSILLLLLGLQLIVAGICSCETISCKVISVEDGDSLTVSDKSGTHHRVRLFGVDAPESGQKYGSNAQQMLSAMVAGKNVRVGVEGFSSDGAVDINVYLSRVSINAAMVKSGYAWVYPEKCKNVECQTWQKFQSFARQNKKGVWQDEKPVSPWSWREKEQKADRLAEKYEALNEAITYNHIRRYKKKTSGRRSLASFPRNVTHRSSYSRPKKQARSKPKRART